MFTSCETKVLSEQIRPVGVTLIICRLLLTMGDASPHETATAAGSFQAPLLLYT